MLQRTNCHYHTFIRPLFLVLLICHLCFSACKEPGNGVTLNHYADADYDKAFSTVDSSNGKTILHFEKYMKGNKDSILKSSAYFSNELVVCLKNKLNRNGLEQFLLTEGSPIVIADSISDEGVYLVVKSGKDIYPLKAMKAKFDSSGLFRYTEPNFLIFESSNQYGIPYTIDQWSLRNPGNRGTDVFDADVDAVEALSRFKYGTEIKYPVLVGVIDGGADTDHPLLRPALWNNPLEIPNNNIDDDQNGLADDYYGWNFASNNKSLFDPTGHGTHVAGIIGARPSATNKFTGIAPQTTLLIAKFSENGTGSNLNAAKAIYYCVKKKTKVINMSFGSDDYSVVLKDAVDTATSKEIILVAAAGNSSRDLGAANPILVYPACYARVMCVASTGKLDQLSSFSNYQSGTYQSPFVRIAAPGDEIYSTVPTGIIAKKSGTSMAAPHVTGAVALILSLYPDADIVTVNRRLKDGADVLPSLVQKVADAQRLNVYRALFQPPESFDLQGKPYREQLVNGVRRDQCSPYANSGDAGIDGSTAAKAFKIASMKQLMNIRDADLTKHFVIMNNIDWFELPPSERQMINKTFAGKLNGQHFSIRNITLDAGASSALFSKIGAGGIVSNLKLTNVNIKGNVMIGALAKTIDGAQLFNVQVEGNVTATMFTAGGIAGVCTNSSIINCYFEGTLKAKHTIGGMAGQVLNNSNINRCHVQADIRADEYAGGIGGMVTKSVITECYAHIMIVGKKYIGGIAGNMTDSRLENSYTEGAVEVTTGSAGGLAGYIKGGGVSYCYSFVFVSGAQSGGLLGYGSNFRVRDSYFSIAFNEEGAGGIPVQPAQLQDRNTFRNWWTTGYWIIPTNYMPILPSLPRSGKSAF